MEKIPYLKALGISAVELLPVFAIDTAEAGADGPTFCFRGPANDSYYILEPNSETANDSGCGNTLNAHNPICRRMISRQFYGRLNWNSCSAT